MSFLFICIDNHPVSPPDSFLPPSVPFPDWISPDATDRLFNRQPVRSRIFPLNIPHAFPCPPSDLFVCTRHCTRSRSSGPGAGGRGRASPVICLPLRFPQRICSSIDRLAKKRKNLTQPFPSVTCSLLLSAYFNSAISFPLFIDLLLLISSSFFFFIPFILLLDVARRYLLKPTFHHFPLEDGGGLLHGG